MDKTEALLKTLTSVNRRVESGIIPFNVGSEKRTAVDTQTKKKS